MSSLKQNIRSVLSDVQTFLVETLKGVKLSGSAKDHKDRLLEKVQQLLDDMPGSAGSYNDGSSGSGSLKISGGGDSASSTNLQSQNDEDSVHYAGNLPNVAVSALKQKLQTGMLDKKKKSGFKSWEALYCVVSANVFYLYKKQTDSKQKEAFCLNGYEFHEAPSLEKDAAKKEMCFELTKPGEPTYQFRAGSKEGMEIWKEAITKGMQITEEAADDEPGDLYDDAEPVTRSSATKPARKSSKSHYSNVDSNHQDHEDGEIYDDIDAFAASPTTTTTAKAPGSLPRPPSAPLPPVPRANQADDGEDYENVASDKKKVKAKPAGVKVRKSSVDVKPTKKEPATATDKLKTSGAAEGNLFPSELKKASSSSTTRPSSAALGRQGPPPKIDILKDSPKDQSTGGHYVNLLSPTSPGKGKSSPRSKSPTSANPKSPTSANPNRNRGLPAVPPEDGAAKTKTAQTPPGKEKPTVQSDSRASPPPTTIGVNNLKKMFEN